MYHVVAATTNPAKIKAITLAFTDVFGAENCRIEGVDVDSGVPRQPLGSLETRTGARNRVMMARQVRPEADFWVGVEAGIEESMTFAWMVIENAHLRGESRSASLVLPESILHGIREGRELGDEMERLTGVQNIKHKGGAIGVFTDGKLSRTSVYHQALLLALVPFHNPIYQIPVQTTTQ
ncbi:MULTISPECIES: inosine/xanthosine triphosphatase [Pectobacterium]|uniref:Inosine/xanthosine triphosphatase n=2 Tax=Pectobacterium TaxID=122277 RepID=A0AAP9LC26_9GAMM|nr:MULTISPECIES: inosine/xanthosine triphosphatase [Pectobacterium]GKW41221.1 non-canonical purine NTP phosphatase [Pectobacterium carotovorum subsp. carotovorum]ASY74782.1 inosine/xanthosine triphosphatase [Pectobacterium polaris]ASY80936.1 inosine/xanthosine triphosphatase [Pectobacterium polaris]KFX10847.1 inositol monophosphatase [Pectobacterium parvum]MBN3215045.1 inosine/xanthosine triphosphatase [Pectobacterium polaris]